MQRRQFIKNTAISLGAAGGVSLGASAAQAGATGGTDQLFEQDADVIVVGGGFAGVVAARDASQLGLRTLLLEARPRLGGRTFTAPFADHQVDVGGTWLGWGQPHIWAECMRYNMELSSSAALQAERFVWFSKSQRFQGGAADYGPLAEQVYSEFFRPAKNNFPQPYQPLLQQQKAEFRHLDSLSSAQAIDKMPLDDVGKEMAKAFASINGHSPSHRSSYLDQLRWLALGGFNQEFMWANLGQYRLKHGTIALLEKMQADSKAQSRLGVVVKKVQQYQGGVVVVDHLGKQYRAKKLIMALPLNTLKDIDFQPGLPKAKQGAFAKGHTGSGTKVYMKIKGGQKKMFAHGREDMPFSFCWSEYDDGDSQILVGFGCEPERIDVNDDEDLQLALQQYFPDVELLESYSYDWNLDPYSKGTWCMYPPGMLSHSFDAMKKPEGHIYFAGADLADGWRGFIDGAVETGIKSAQWAKNTI